MDFTYPDGRPLEPMPRHTEIPPMIEAEFEQFPSEATFKVHKQPGNPYQYREYPAMVFRARKDRSGKFAVGAEIPPEWTFATRDLYDRAKEQAHQFAAGNQRVVKSDAERAAAHREGWRDSPEEALELAQAERTEVSNETAQRHHEERSMSEAARAEAAQFDAENPGHQPVIPEQPIRRRGRPRKEVPSPTEE